MVEKVGGKTDGKDQSSYFSDHTSSHSLLSKEASFWLATGAGMLPSVSENVGKELSTTWNHIEKGEWGDVAQSALVQGAEMGVGLSWMVNKARPREVRLLGAGINAVLGLKFSWDTAQTAGKMWQLHDAAMKPDCFDQNVQEAQKTSGKFVADGLIGILGAHAGFLGEHGANFAINRWGKPLLADTCSISADGTLTMGHGESPMDSTNVLAMSKLKFGRGKQFGKKASGGLAKEPLEKKESIVEKALDENSNNNVEQPNEKKLNPAQIKEVMLDSGKTRTEWAHDVFNGKTVENTAEAGENHDILKDMYVGIQDMRAAEKGRTAAPDTFKACGDSARTCIAEVLNCLGQRRENLKRATDELRSDETDLNVKQAEQCLNDGEDKLAEETLSKKLRADDILAVAERTPILGELFVEARSGNYPPDAHVMFTDKDGRLVYSATDDFGKRSLNFPLADVAKGYADFELMAKDGVVQGAAIFGSPLRNGDRPLLKYISDIPSELENCQTLHQFRMSSRLTKNIAQLDLRTEIKPTLSKNGECVNGICGVDSSFAETRKMIREAKAQGLPEGVFGKYSEVSNEFKQGIPQAKELHDIKNEAEAQGLPEGVYGKYSEVPNEFKQGIPRAKELDGKKKEAEAREKELDGIRKEAEAQGLPEGVFGKYSEVLDEFKQGIPRAKELDGKKKEAEAREKELDGIRKEAEAQGLPEGVFGKYSEVQDEFKQGIPQAKELDGIRKEAAAQGLPEGVYGKYSEVPDEFKQNVKSLREPDQSHNAGGDPALNANPDPTPGVKPDPLMELRLQELAKQESKIREELNKYEKTGQNLNKKLTKRVKHLRQELDEVQKKKKAVVDGAQTLEEQTGDEAESQSQQHSEPEPDESKAVTLGLRTKAEIPVDQDTWLHEEPTMAEVVGKAARVRGSNGEAGVVVLADMDNTLRQAIDFGNRDLPAESQIKYETQVLSNGREMFAFLGKDAYMTHFLKYLQDNEGVMGSFSEKAGAPTEEEFARIFQHPKEDASDNGGAGPQPQVNEPIKTTDLRTKAEISADQDKWLHEEATIAEVAGKAARVRGPNGEAGVVVLADNDNTLRQAIDAGNQSLPLESQIKYSSQVLSNGREMFAFLGKDAFMAHFLKYLEANEGLMGSFKEKAAAPTEEEFARIFQRQEEGSQNGGAGKSSNGPEEENKKGAAGSEQQGDANKGSQSDDSSKTATGETKRQEKRTDQRPERKRYTFEDCAPVERALRRESELLAEAFAATKFGNKVTFFVNTPDNVSLKLNLKDPITCEEKPMEFFKEDFLAGNVPVEFLKNHADGYAVMGKKYRDGAEVKQPNGKPDTEVVKVGGAVPSGLAPRTSFSDFRRIQAEAIVDPTVNAKLNSRESLEATLTELEREGSDIQRDLDSHYDCLQDGVDDYVLSGRQLSEKNRRLKAIEVYKEECYRRLGQGEKKGNAGADGVREQGYNEKSQSANDSGEAESKQSKSAEGDAGKQQGENSANLDRDAFDPKENRTIQVESKEKLPAEVIDALNRFRREPATFSPGRNASFGPSDAWSALQQVVFNVNSRSRMLFEEGETAKAQGKTADAETKIAEAEAWAQTLDKLLATKLPGDDQFDAGDRANALSWLGELFRIQGKTHQAENCLKPAIAMMDAKGFPKGSALEAQILESYAKLIRATGDSRAAEAREFEKRANDINTRLKEREGNTDAGAWSKITIGMRDPLTAQFSPEKNKNQLAFSLKVLRSIGITF